MSNVEKVSIALSNELLRSVRAAVASGEYASSSEVVREALRQWKGQRQKRRATVPERPALALIESKRGALRALSERFGVEQLSVFGSALREDFDPTRSDIDLAVVFDSSRPKRAQDYFAFKEALEQLLERPVDLVELEAMPEGRLKRSIERSLTRVYEREAA